MPASKSTPELVVVPRRQLMRLAARRELLELRIADAVRLLETGETERALVRLEPSRARRQPARMSESSMHTQEDPDG